jgi:glycerol-3-phosphate dehydrogenase (NAD(P)+)
MEEAIKYLGKIGIIGNGSWGTALAKMLNDNQIPFTWWIRDEKAIQHLQKRSHNLNYLTSVQFNMQLIGLSSDLHLVLKEADTLIFCVPSAYAQEVIESVAADSWKGKNIISAIKGILPKPHQLINDYLAANYAFPIEHYAAITGPCHAEEVANERLSYLTFSSLNTELAAAAATLFKTNYINTFHNNDIWGAQFAAVLKNIYAVGAGIAHGLDYGDNFLSVYITNCYKEMYQFLNYHF